MACWTDPTPSCLVSQAANSAVESFVKALGSGVIALMKFFSSFWLDIGSPQVATAGGGSFTEASSLSQIQGNLGVATGLIAIISFTLAIGKLVWDAQHENGARNIVRQLIAVSGATLAAAAVVALLITAGDQFSPWVISQASGGTPSAGMDKLIVGSMGGGAPSNILGFWIVIFLVCLLGGIVQCGFMIVRGAALMVLMGFLPSVAAGAATDEGFARLKRIGMVILGFALYKPVAAIIYATGLRLMSSSSAGSATGPDGSIQNALYGVVIMLMAAIALPAFIKFLMPLAAVGSSSAFSGGALIGAVAAGAAIVATAGAGAGAAGAGAGGSGAGGAASAGGGGTAAGTQAPPPAGPSAGNEGPKGGGSGGSSSPAPAPAGNGGGKDNTGADGSGSEGGRTEGATGSEGGRTEGATGSEGGGSQGANGSDGSSESGGHGTSGSSGQGPGGANGSSGQGTNGSSTGGGGSQGAAGTDASNAGGSSGGGSPQGSRVAQGMSSVGQSAAGSMNRAGDDAAQGAETEGTQS